MHGQLQAVQSELSSLRAAVNAPRPESEKVQELDQWMNQVKSAPVKVETKDNMVFFRGGYNHMNRARGGTLDPTVVPGVAENRNGVAVGTIDDQDGWYFGAGFDFSVSDNLFGLMDNTEVLAELLVDYRQLAEKKSNGLSVAETDVLAALGVELPAANTQTATVNQLSIGASPKIKFMKGSKFRPWIIPIGLELNVISPPSDAITVLNPGMQFGAGADYNLWNNIYVGADARWHQSLDDVDGVDTDGVTAGGYIGLGF